jgi:hypothetical protein
LTRRATRDVDALFQPHGIVHEEALTVAEELGLPRWWLNEQARSYVAPCGDPSASRVFDHPGLRVFAASPEHLLAMKAFAARPRDTEDIRQLVRLLDLHTVNDVIASVERSSPKKSRQGSSAAGQGLRCGQRPPEDRHCSSRTVMIRRWPPPLEPRTPPKTANQPER